MQAGCGAVRTVRFDLDLFLCCCVEFYDEFVNQQCDQLCELLGLATDDTDDAADTGLLPTSDAGDSDDEQQQAQARAE